MRRFTIPPASARWSWFCTAMLVVLGPSWIVLSAFLFTALTTLRGWTNEPRRFWRPFTLVSLLLAGLAGGAWLWRADELVLMLPGQGDRPSLPSAGWPRQLVYSFTTYIVCCLALAPHTTARLWYAARAFRRANASDRD